MRLRSSALQIANLSLATGIRLGAGAAHQHCALAGARAVSLEEGLDGLIVADDGEGARSVHAPQAAIETPGVHHAGERVPDVR
jgi:hypothetical protein